MPNIIINNYCNQKCSYCFANENMNDATLQKNMTLATYLSILKYLKNIGDPNARILGGEPIIFPNIRKYIDIAQKGGFNIIIFSNINISPEKFQYIFTGVKNLRTNCNINDENFYSQEEKNNIRSNLKILQQENIPTIIGYNITDISIYPDFNIALAREFGIKKINFKVTNSCLGDKLLIDTGTRDFGVYIFGLIKKYYNEFDIELSCGLSRGIFTSEELIFIEQTAKIKIFFGCEGHRGKFDINTDGNIFKCYPLESLYKSNKISIITLANNNIPLEDTLDTLYKGVYSSGECTAHKSIKGYTIG